MWKIHDVVTRTHEEVQKYKTNFAAYIFAAFIASDLRSADIREF